MSFDIYLSEMAVSDQHGGGLTLQRLLGEDLGSIAKFYHVSRFAEDYPPTDGLTARSRTFPFWAESNIARRWIGCRPSNWLARRRLLQRMHCRALVRAIRSRVGQGRPLRVLTCPQGVLSLRAMEHLCRAEDLRYVTWMMDDHLLRFQHGRWHYPRETWNMMKEHLCAASNVFVISPVLGELYQREFNVRYNVLFGSADPVGPPVWQPASRGAAKFGYFGSMGEWQRDALVRLSDLLRSVNATLDVFSSGRELPPSLRLPGVTPRGFIPSSAVIPEMRKYDAVVLPTGFSDSLRHLSEFNIAIKMSECLASGIATLVVGPKYAAMVRFLEAYDAAWIESELTVASLAANIASLLSAKARKERLGNARDLVERELSTTVMRQKWLRVCSSNV
jgi:glycosyltransferase involved in cell wall biosynthesis